MAILALTQLRACMCMFTLKARLYHQQHSFHPVMFGFALLTRHLICNLIYNLVYNRLSAAMHVALVEILKGQPLTPAL